MKGGKERWRRILDRDLFIFILGLEVKRARRYQNFFCLLFLTLEPSSQNDSKAGIQTCYQILVNLLMDEMQETDLLGSLGKYSSVIFVPYADISAGDWVTKESIVEKTYSSENLH